MSMFSACLIKRLQSVLRPRRTVLESEMGTLSLTIEKIYYRHLSSQAILISGLLGRIVGVGEVQMQMVQGCGIAS
jgi:hypothetical protein